jgi:L-amino acid N-acyltransferase YncA
MKNGFERCGTFSKKGAKFEKEFEVVWMQKSLKTSKPFGREDKSAH